jgi:hypothetical protein
VGSKLQSKSLFPEAHINPRENIASFSHCNFCPVVMEISTVLNLLFTSFIFNNQYTNTLSEGTDDRQNSK